MEATLWDGKEWPSGRFLPDTTASLILTGKDGSLYVVIRKRDGFMPDQPSPSAEPAIEVISRSTCWG